MASKKIGKSCLEEISIRSLGVIESSNIEFKEGLTVLTGETGAGKTMVLTALGLVLGAKSDSDLVRQGQERATVSGRFAVPKQLAQEITNLGGEVEDESVVITRTVSTAGKSRVLVGGSVSSTAVVANFAASLVEIHAQASSSKLNKPAVARELLDRYANLDLSNYQEQYSKYQIMLERISLLKKELSQADAQIAALKELSGDYAKYAPKSGELDQIDNEIAKLGSVEYLNQAVSNALNLLEEEDHSAVNLLQQIRKILESARDKDKQLDQITERYTENLLNLSDIASDLTSYLSDLQADPIRFEKLQERKAALNLMLKKFGKGSDRQLAYEQLLLDGQNATMKIADLSGGETRVRELEKECAGIFTQMQKEAELLSAERKLYGAKLSEQVTSEVKNLSMPNASFLIHQVAADLKNPDSYSASGVDEISILFSSHAQSTLLPLNKVASGGELSRVMLALEVVIAEAEPVGTYIFDEVDAGVGGKAAIEVGRRLAKLAQSAQVIVITHLAQVAVWADNHLVVKKNENGLVTQSDVIQVNEKERRIEIARMLSGQEESITAQEHAAELLAIVANA